MYDTWDLPSPAPGDADMVWLTGCRSQKTLPVLFVGRTFEIFPEVVAAIESQWPLSDIMGCWGETESNWGRVLSQLHSMDREGMDRDP